MSRALTPEEMAVALDVSAATVRNHARDLGGFQVGHQWRFPPSALTDRGIVIADALPHLAPPTLPELPEPTPCDDPPASPSTNAQTAGTASAGASTDANAKKAGSTRKRKRTLAASKSRHGFAAAFPEHSAAS